MGWAFFFLFFSTNFSSYHPLFGLFFFHPISFLFLELTNLLCLSCIPSPPLFSSPFFFLKEGDGKGELFFNVKTLLYVC